MLAAVLLGSSFLVGCRNPFMPEIPTGGGGNPQPVVVNAKEPVIVAQPTSEITVSSGEEFTLSVNATSPDEGTLSYQWYEASSLDENGSLISDEVSQSYTTSYTFQGDETEKVLYYYVVVTNTNDKVNGTKDASVTSSRTKVTVNNKTNAQLPVITAQPEAYEGEQPDSLSLSVTASVSDGGTISYQWYKASDATSNGTSIDGATSATYELPESELVSGSVNYYYVEITNTNTAVDGNKLATKTSDRVLVKITTVQEPDDGGNNDVVEPDDGGNNDVVEPDDGGNNDVVEPEEVPTQGKYSAVSPETWATADYKLGATVVGSDVEFAVYSANAEKILLEIYEKAYGVDAKYTYWMEKGSDNIWRAKVAGIGTGTLYAFRAWGPNWPYSEKWTRGNSSAGFISDYDSAGNRFNPNKVLFDPYAKEISHDKSHPDVLGMVTGATGSEGESNPSVIYSTGATNKVNGNPSRNFDTGKYAPKAVVIDDSTNYGTKPQIPQEKAIIYEAHVRGITKHSSSANLSTILNGIEGFENVVDIPAEYQGTYKGAGMLAPYLKALGVNTIELLPVHESDNDANPDDAPGGNYWAYMTYGYFAPDRRYSSDKSLGGPTKEFKEMVAAFHEAGMEVYLDVVFNHSGEGGPWYGTKDSYNTAELTFMRGLDCSEYYCLTPGNVGDHWQSTGCGNNLQCDNPTVQKLILDSLTYWIDEMGVDGYRFDLAPVIGREFDGKDWSYNANAQILKDIAALGASKDAEMIAEAWDIGAYGVGTFPSGWGEWNGRYRDAMRNFVGNGNWGSVGDFINGDYANFNDQGGPHKTVNFIVAHDGFTLADLCSYAGKGNAQNGTLTWPFGPSDGGNGDDNSLKFVDWTSEATQKASKRQANRNYTAIQMMSRGVPMIVWGDEFCRTQNGNNNPYNIDSVCGWSNYNMINTTSPHKVATGEDGEYHNNFGTFGNDAGVNGNFMFMNYMLKLKASEPALNVSSYDLPYEFSSPDGQDSWLGAACIHIKGSTTTDGSDYLLCMNMKAGETSFTVPAAASGKEWVRIVDTQTYFESEFNCWEDSKASVISDSYGVSGWSVVILKEVDEGTGVAGSGSGNEGGSGNTGGTSTVTLSITHDTGYGKSIFVTGTFVEGNSWTVFKEADWNSGNVWTVTVTIPASGTFEWKPVKGASGSTSPSEWYAGDNLTYPSTTSITW